MEHCISGMHASSTTFTDASMTQRNHPDPCGDITFPPLCFTEQGVYHFTIRELTPSSNEWTTDKAEIPVVVTVEGEGAEQTATVDYPNGIPQFTNTYRKCPVWAIIMACKTTYGCSVPAEGTFSFNLYNEQGALVGTAVNNKCGGIVFPAQLFFEPGTYIYTIAEAASYDPCWVTDQTVHRVMVIVAPDENGCLRVRVVYEGNRLPLFCNRFICGNRCCNPCQRPPICCRWICSPC